MIQAKEKYKDNISVISFSGAKIKSIGEIKINFKNKTIHSDTVVLYNSKRDVWVEIYYGNKIGTNII